MPSGCTPHLSPAAGQIPAHIRSKSCSLSCILVSVADKNTLHYNIRHQLVVSQLMSNACPMCRILIFESETFLSNKATCLLGDSARMLLKALASALQSSCRHLPTQTSVDIRTLPAPSGLLAASKQHVGKYQFNAQYADLMG